MPALDAKDYAEFSRILEELGPEVDNLNGASQSFAKDMIEKNQLYGEHVFVSPKQLAWLQKLHEEFVGNTDHSVSERITELHDPQGAPDPDDPRFQS